MSRGLALALALGLATPVPAAAQKLRDRLAQLFILGSHTTPLQVSAARDPANPAAGAVADDGFLPSAVAANGAILGFLTKWVSAEPGNIPISATSGGVTFNFSGATPIEGTISPGPIVAERAQTVGRGRMMLGAGFSHLSYNTLRGVPLENVPLLFTHANESGEGCAAPQVSDCSAHGVPSEENDLLQVLLSLDMTMSVGTVFATYGLFDNVDLGVVVPMVHSRLDASSRASVVPLDPTGAGRAAHFLAGSVDDPVLTSSQVVQGSATGLGDIGARLKVKLAGEGPTGVALMGDVRFPTGDEADFLGAGYTAVRALGVASTRFGDFSPHLNVGYLWRSGDGANDAVLASAGFDQVLSPWAMLAAGLVTEFQVGTSVMQAPAPVTFTEPVARSVLPMDVPGGRDNPVTASFGFKFTTRSNLTAVVNSLIPVTHTGPRPDLAWSGGLEYDF